MFYFHFNLSRDFQNSSYNNRSDTASEKVIRGNILSADGEILAESTVSEDGTETRNYPLGRIFSHVIGFTSHGGSGLEKNQNYNLLTSDSFVVDQVKREFSGEKKQGDTVVTTLDSTLQKIAYNALGDHKGAVVVMDAGTGQILSMVSKPDFDPNKIAKEYETLVSDEANSSLLNRAAIGLYPPGSTFKIVTALAYYRQYGTIEGFSYDCDGEITVDDHTIHCYKNEKHGMQDFTGIFANSCNTGFSSVGLTIQKKVFTNTAEDLLFNQDLPSPVRYKSSRFSLDKSASTALTMQTSIGQGDTLVTPYHMCLIASAIANKGKLMTPYLVDHIENDSGTVIKSYEPEEYGSLISKTEAEFLEELMKATVTDGTGSKLKSDKYTAAGKTGTADYTTESGASPHSWFVGYAKAGNLKIAVSIIVESSGAGSKYAVPIARDLFDAYFLK